MPSQSRITGAVSLVAAQAVVLVLGYATHLWIGRVLGPAPYGIYGIVLSLQSIIGLILTLGIPVAVSRFVAQDVNSAQLTLRQALYWQTMLAGGVALGTALLSRLLAHLLGDEKLTVYILFTAVIIFAQAYYPLYVQFLSGLHRFNKQAVLTVVYAIAKLGGALALIYVFQLFGALAGFAVGGIIAAALGWFWTRSSEGRVGTPPSLKAFLHFAGIYALILIGLQILISLDLFMVKAILHSDTQAGYYNAAVTLSRISYLLLQAISFVLLPSVSALTRSGEAHNQAISFIKDTLRYLIALIVPSVSLAAATSRPLISLFFSKGYAAAAPILTILMIGVGSLAFYLLLINIVAGAGRAKFGLYLTTGLVFLSGALGSFLIPRYGLIGAAWQTTITGLIGLVSLSMYTFRVFGIQFPIRSTFNIIFATAVALIPTYLWQATSLTLPLQYIVSGVLYIAALWLVGEVTKADRERVASIHPLLRWIAAK